MAKRSNTSRLESRMRTQLGAGLVSAMTVLHEHYARQIQRKIVNDTAGSKYPASTVIGRSVPGEYPAKDLGHGLANWRRNGIILKGLRKTHVTLEARSGFNGIPATSDPDDDGGEHMQRLTEDDFGRLGPQHAYGESLAQMRAAFKAVVR